MKRLVNRLSGGVIETIRYYLDDPKALKEMGKKDRDLLLDTVEYLKRSTMSRMIYDAVGNSPSMVDQLQQAQQDLMREYERLSNELQEHEGKESDVVRSTNYREDKKEFDKKREMLKGKISKIRNLKDSVADIPSFIENLCMSEVTQDNEKGLKELEQYLTDTLATSMANGYMTIETVGETPLFDKEANGSNFKGYIANEDTIRKFIDVMEKGDELLAASNACALEERYARADVQMENARKEMEFCAKIVELFNSPEYKEVEDNMKKMGQLIDHAYAKSLSEDAEAREEENNKLAVQNKNPFSRLWDRVKSLWSKEKEEEKLEEPKKEEPIYAKELRVIYGEHDKKRMEDPKYAEMFELYKKASKFENKILGLDGYKDTGEKKAMACRKIGVDVGANFCMLTDSRNDVEKTKRDYLGNMKSAERQFNEAKETAVAFDKMRGELKLSPEIQEMMKGKTSQELKELHSRFVGEPSQTRYGISGGVAYTALKAIYGDDKKEEIIAGLGEPVDTKEVGIKTVNVFNAIQQFRNLTRKEIEDNERV